METPAATLHRWLDTAEDHPAPHIDRRLIQGSRMMVAQVTLHPGFHVDAHRHECEQIACVASGKVRFVIGEPGSVDRREITVCGGETLVLPPGVLHEVDAHEESIVYDLFSSPGERMGVDAER